MTEHFTFPNTESGLTLALTLSLSLRRHGYRTRLAERAISHTRVVTVVATPKPRPNRKARGCTL
jgi:hypothetical protein